MSLFNTASFEISYTNTLVKDKGTFVSTPTHVSVFSSEGTSILFREEVEESLTIFLNVQSMSLLVIKNSGIDDARISTVEDIPMSESQSEYAAALTLELQKLVNDFLSEDRVNTVDEATKARVLEMVCEAPLFAIR